MPPCSTLCGGGEGGGGWLVRYKLSGAYQVSRILCHHHFVHLGLH